MASSTEEMLIKRNLVRVNSNSHILLAVLSCQQEEWGGKEEGKNVRKTFEEESKRVEFLL